MTIRLFGIGEQGRVPESDQIGACSHRTHRDLNQRGGAISIIAPRLGAVHSPLIALGSAP